MTIYEITEAFRNLLAMADDPDVDSEAIADTLEAMDGEIEEKADGVARVLCEMNTTIDSMKEQEQRMSKRRKSLESKRDSLKKRLEDMMRLANKTKFKTDSFSFNIQKNGGKIPIVVDVETADLPDDYVIITEKPDTEALRQYMEEHGGECEWAHFGEVGESLRIR